jgi:hypothetical protein
MSLNDLMTSLMDTSRRIQGRQDKLSLQDLQLMLNSISALRFRGDQYSSNIDSTRDSGIYYCNTGLYNKPVAGVGLLVVLSPGNKGWSNGTTTQFFIDVDNRQLYQRSMNSEYAWTSWTKLGDNSTQ